MSWIIFIIFMLILLAAAGQAPKLAKISPQGEEGNYNASTRWAGRAATGLILVILLIVTLTNSVHSITRGHDGLVETFGKITGHRQNGFAFTWPWQSVEIVNVQQQSICADGKAPEGSSCQATYEPFSKESIDAHVKAVVTYQVDSNDIQALYTNIGPDYVNKIILPNMNQILKEEVVKYNAVDIVPNRQDITDHIQTRITPILSASAIKVIAVNMTNIDFDQAVKDAIQQKVIAAQQAQAAQAQVLVKQAEADQAVAQARGAAEVVRQKALGDADATRTAAQAQADANNLINASLTPQLIQVRTIDKLAPNLQVVGIPTANGTILDLGGLLTPRAPAPAPAR